jgi:hypothetical protein
MSAWAVRARAVARPRRNGGGCVNVIEASGLGKRFGSTWALREPVFSADS